MHINYSKGKLTYAVFIWVCRCFGVFFFKGQKELMVHSEKLPQSLSRCEEQLTSSAHLTWGVTRAGRLMKWLTAQACRDCGSASIGSSLSPISVWKLYMCGYIVCFLVLVCILYGSHFQLDWRRGCKSDKMLWNFGQKMFSLLALLLMVLQHIHHFIKLAPQSRDTVVGTVDKGRLKSWYF